MVQEGDLTALLLDVSELALCRLNRPELSEAISAQSSPGPGQLQAALRALQAVLKLSDSARPLSLDTCCDLMLLFIDVSQVSITMAHVCFSHASQLPHIEQTQLIISKALLLLWCSFLSPFGFSCLAIVVKHIHICMHTICNLAWYSTEHGHSGSACKGSVPFACRCLPP